MRLVIADGLPGIGAQWAEALRGVEIRHHDPLCEVELSLGRDLFLTLRILNPIDTASPTFGRLESLVIGNTGLTYFPGTRLARIWLAAMWAGYIQHEALELVAVDGVRTFDPHKPLDIGKGNRLYPHCHDRGIRDGLPPALTPESLYRALCTTMDPDVAAGLMA